MTIWLIEPHDPLIIRDGRPFGPQPGVQANSLPFPFPSTTTGGVRTRAGLNDQGIFTAKADDVKKIKVKGPLLVQLSSNTNDSNPEEWLVPAPADALLFSTTEGNELIVKRLVPLEKSEVEQTDFNGNYEDSLMLVGLSQSDQRKSAKNAPLFWYWKAFQDWLIHPVNEQNLQPSSLGHNGPERERRIHVSIDGNSLVGKEGALFGTSGREFTHTNGKQEQRLIEAKRLALAVAVDDDSLGSMKVREGFTGFGGERRVVNWQKSDSNLPECPKELVDEIAKNKACRLILLTPAFFTEGYRPTWLFQQASNVKQELKAIAIQRLQVVSGWDLEIKRPKPTRRLAPVGSVFFLSLEGTDEAIKSWISNIWMQCISDEEQARNDGFGLAVIGAWSGKPESME
jgi:CRISPR-associated protein Cmr3